MELRDYVNYGGSLRLMQPYLAAEVGFYGFIIKADIAALQKLCDARLNEPCGMPGRFRPNGPFVVLAFNNLARLTSKNPPDSQKGWFSEQEFAVWMLLTDTVRERSFWFHPYIFVDNPYALALGREVYGFPKSLGVFEIPDNPDQATAFSMKTWLIPQYGPDAKGSLAELVRVTAGGTPEPFGPWLEDMGKLLGEAVDVLRNLGVGHGEAALRTIDDLINKRAPMVFLKQFPDAQQAEKACYMALVEALSHMTAFLKARVSHHPWQVEFTPCDTHPIARDLGLPAGVLEPVLSFYVEFNFEIDEGVEIWNANGGAQ